MVHGGNQRARQYFKQHGYTETGTDKIEQKVNPIELPTEAFCEPPLYCPWKCSQAS